MSGLLIKKRNKIVYVIVLDGYECKYIIDVQTNYVAHDKKNLSFCHVLMV